MALFFNCPIWLPIEVCDIFRFVKVIAPSKCLRNHFSFRFLHLLAGCPRYAWALLGLRSSDCIKNDCRPSLYSDWDDHDIPVLWKRRSIGLIMRVSQSAIFLYATTAIFLPTFLVYVLNVRKMANNSHITNDLIANLDRLEMRPPPSTSLLFVGWKY